MTAWWVFSPELGWQVRDGRFCGVGIVRWCRCKPGRREQVCRLELSPPFSIKVRPLAGGLSRRDLHGVSIFIEAFDQTVDPSEAQRFSNYVFVGDRLLPGVTFIENEPDPWARLVVLCQPCPPIFAASEMEGYEVWHTYYGPVTGGFMNDQWLWMILQFPAMGFAQQIGEKAQIRNQHSPIANL